MSHFTNEKTDQRVKHWAQRQTENKQQTRSESKTDSKFILLCQTEPLGGNLVIILLRKSANYDYHFFHVIIKKRYRVISKNIMF